MDKQLAISLNINAGPLAQVSFGSISLPSIRNAIQLTTGAYGWFKGIERSQSLVHLLESYNAQLTSTSAFNLVQYRECRTWHDNMVGVIVENGGTTAVTLPNGSSATITNIPGMTCLRAVACCLLCLCDQNATVAILQKLLPGTLIRSESGSADDQKIEVEGPFLTGLKQWVATVALEEEGNTFKDHLLKCAREALVQLEEDGDGDGVQQQHGDRLLDELRRWSHTIDSGDEALILGALKWILTPCHQRTKRRYPTRSLRVWTAASIMSQLGFRVSAANWTIRDSEGFKSAMDCDRQEDLDDNMMGDSGKYDVFLVVTHRTSDVTDPDAELIAIPDVMPVPRAMFLQDIPAAALKHVDAMQPPLGTKGSFEYLNEAYKFAFKEAAKVFQSVVVDNFAVKIELRDINPRARPGGKFEHRAKAIFDPFSPHIHSLCAPILREFEGDRVLEPDAIGWDFADADELFEDIRHPRPRGGTS